MSSFCFRNLPGSVVSFILQRVLYICILTTRNCTIYIQASQLRARVPCVPPYCLFQCAAHPKSVWRCDATEQEVPMPAKITCEIDGVMQTFYNIVFGIPEQEIVSCVPEKSFDFAHIVPGNLETYIFGTDELEYKRNYRESFYAYTQKKKGWDCMRHYEILASGTVPYFKNLHKAPRTVLSLLPKALIEEGMRIPGVNATHIDHSTFDYAAYYSVACRILDYTRQYLSTKSIARHILEVMGKSNARHVLLLSGKQKTAEADYMRDMLVHGMRDLLGDGAVDVPAYEFMYEYPNGIPPQKLMKDTLYGKGFSYAHRLPYIEINRDNLTTRIAAREFDVIIYGCTQNSLPYLDAVLAHYDPSSIAIVNGEDWHGWKRIQNPEHPQYRLFNKAVHFVRELPDQCPPPRG